MFSKDNLFVASHILLDDTGSWSFITGNLPYWIVTTKTRNKPVS